MNKRYLLPIFLFIVMLFPITVKGFYSSSYTCTDIEKANLRKLASNVAISYDYVEDSGAVRFNTTLTNLTSDIYVVDKTTGQSYYYNGISELTISGYYPGTKIQYEIYASKEGCISGYLSVKYVNLPNYNNLYKNPLCKGMEKYDVCSKWQLVNISYEEFEDKIKSYQKKDGNQMVVETNKSIMERILEFYAKYYIFILGAIIIVCSPAIIIYNKKNKFDL